jgi:hypothetical protein
LSSESHGENLTPVIVAQDRRAGQSAVAGPAAADTLTK